MTRSLGSFSGHTSNESMDQHNPLETVAHRITDTGYTTSEVEPSQSALPPYIFGYTP